MRLLNRILVNFFLILFLSASPSLVLADVRTDIMSSIGVLPTNPKPRLLVLNESPVLYDAMTEPRKTLGSLRSGSTIELVKNSLKDEWIYVRTKESKPREGWIQSKSASALNATNAKPAKKTNGQPEIVLNIAHAPTPREIAQERLAREAEQQRQFEEKRRRDQQIARDNWEAEKRKEQEEEARMLAKEQRENEEFAQRQQEHADFVARQSASTWRSLSQPSYNQGYGYKRKQSDSIYSPIPAEDIARERNKAIAQKQAQANQQQKSYTKQNSPSYVTPQSSVSPQQSITNSDNSSQPVTSSQQQYSSGSGSLSSPSSSSTNSNMASSSSVSNQTQKKSKVYEPMPTSASGSNDSWWDYDMAVDLSRTEAINKISDMCRSKGARVDVPSRSQVIAGNAPSWWNFSAPDCRQGGFNAKEWKCESKVSGTCYRMQ